MILRKILFVILCVILRQAAAQQNWAAVPCYQPKLIEVVNNMFLDSVHNEIILNSAYGNQACNITYKGVFAYNSSGFHDLDFGLNKFNPNPSTGGNRTLGCIPYNGKTLFGGFFSSVGSGTLQAEAIALWNGTVWDTFPKRCFKYNPTMAGNFAAISGFLKHDGKLWIYGGFDSLGGVPGKNLYSFDGNTFTPYTIPVNNYNGINKMIIYKNKLIAIGPFYDYPSWSISRVAMYDGVSWTSVGTGILGNIAEVNDLVIYNDTLYISGSWAKSAGNVSNYIAKWDGSQLLDAGFGGFYGWGSVRKLLVYRNRLYAFGNFNYAADQKTYGMAYYENGKWTVSPDSIANYGINGAVVYNNDLYIAGGFKNINKDTTIKNFARLLCPDFDAASGCISGISENNGRIAQVKVFPNPVHEELSIKGLTGSASRLTILNTLGQVMREEREFHPSQSIDVSDLASGVYTIRLYNGGKALIGKFVKSSP
jgi:hypothetical protein